MSYTPTNWANGKAPALNAENLNKIEQELKKLDDIVSVPDITETTETTLPNSYNGRLLVEEIGGVCEQDSTTGNQLLNPKEQFNGFPNMSENGYVISWTGKIAWSQSGFIVRDVKAGEVWYASAESLVNVVANRGTVAFQQRSAEKKILSTSYLREGQLSVNFTISENTADFTILVIANTSENALESDNTITVKGLMLSKSEGNAWEPYTGGIPSPNPEYPQEIKKTVVSEIKTHGKNLLNVNKEPYLADHLVNRTYGFYPSESCDVYRIDKPKLGNIYFKMGMTELNTSVGFYSSDGTILYAKAYENLNSFFVNHTVSADYLLVTVKKGDEAFMVSYEDIPYEPYKESSFTFSKPIDLYGNGDVQDVITPKQIKRAWGEYAVPSTISVTIYDDVDGISRFRVNTSPKTIQNDVNLISEYFGSGYTLQEINTMKLPYHMCIYINELWFTTQRGEYTAGEFKEFIVGKKIYYTFETETTEELPTADQIALNSLATYDGITYLEFDSEVKPTIKAEYGTSKVGGYTLEALLTARSK